MKKIFILLCVIFISGRSICNTHISYYIATNGSSLNKGTKAHPFSSLEDAKEAIRQLKINNQFPKGGITVWLREGIYELPRSFSLLKDDSGTENGSIIYSAFPGERVILTGGKKLVLTRSNRFRKRWPNGSFRKRPFLGSGK